MSIVTLRNAVSEKTAERKRVLDEAAKVVEAAGTGALSADQEKSLATAKASASRLNAEIQDLEGRLKVLTDAAEAEAANPDSRYARSISGDTERNLLRDPKRGFTDSREFLMAVVQKHTRGRSDSRLDALDTGRLATAGSDEHSSFNFASAGIFVPEALFPGVLETPAAEDPFGAATTKVPMAGPTVKIRARTDKDHTTSVSGGFRWFRREEAGTVESSKGNTEEIVLHAYPLMGVSYEAEELITYSPQSIVALIQQGMAKELPETLKRERLRGGAGQMHGILNASTNPCLVIVNKQEGQKADTITYINVADMYARSWNPKFWMASRTCIPQLLTMAHVIGTGGVPVFVPNTMPNTLFGMPVYFDENMSVVGDLGDLALVSPGEYLEGRLGGEGFAESMHVRFLTHERTFKFFLNVGGTPWWRTALTPTKGVTLSPFVILQAR